MIELPPLTDVPPPKYLPIDKRGAVATRPVVAVPRFEDPDADAPPADGATRIDPARTAFMAPLGAPPPAAADDALEYVPAPPHDRTDAAPKAPDIADVHKTQTTANRDI